MNDREANNISIQAILWSFVIIFKEEKIIDINQSLNRFIGGVIRFFMNQFICLVYILFLFAGVVCGVISGFIEYEVFAELYKKITGTGLPFFSIPLLIVFSLEITKIFLVFLDKQANLTNNEGYISDRVTFNRVRILLIVTSGICTLIFSFYSLHNPEYEKQLGEKTREASSRYTEQLKQINTEFEKRMAGINAEVEMWRQRLDTEAQQVINGVSEGPRYKAYEKQYNQAIQNRDALRGELESNRLQQVKELNRAHEQKLTSVAESLKNSQTVQNKMLSATLQVLNSGPNYPQWQYLVTIVLISLLLTVALESVIICSFRVLAIYHGELFELNLFRKTAEQKMQGLAGTVDDIHQAELDAARHRMTREKQNTVRTLKDISSK